MNSAQGPEGVPTVNDVLPAIWSSYDESPEVAQGHKEDFLWARVITRTDRPQAPPGAEGKLASGSPIPEVARELRISEATFYRWRNRYGTMSSSEAKRLKELEKENAHLKKFLAEKELDIDILKEMSRGNFQARPGEERR